eukprot:CAMPEP_0172885496 /NCGR_PEP_ID=MMETSP1075-20121228/128207_1 /TAXON_ID=2916 /ORGANISM="Ceratium fusus, Strain PA161109" /LENGTH=30 /DNA_ID= /DNA_START= /DNA_END= /DNA_ORIENTATION=
MSSITCLRRRRPRAVEEYVMAAAAAIPKSP